MTVAHATLLCRLGIHRPAWQPALRTGRAWLQIRRCARCGTELPRHHR